MKNNIPKIMEDRNINITQLSLMANIGRTTLSEIVNSEKILDKTKIGILKSIAQNLNVYLSELYSNEYMVTLNYFKQINDFLVLGNEIDLKDNMIQYLHYYIAVVSIESNGTIKNYPIVLAEQNILDYLLSAEFLTEFELKMIKEKDEKLFKEISSFDNLCITNSRHIDQLQIIEDISKHVLEAYYKQITDTFDTRVIEISLVNHSKERPNIMASLPNHVSIQWLDEQDVSSVESFYTYDYNVKTKEISKKDLKPKQRILPIWFNL